MCQPQVMSLASLANKLTDGNHSELANKISQFLQRVSSDLPRDLNVLISAEFIIPVLGAEKQLIKLDISKSLDNDDVPT